MNFSLAVLSTLFAVASARQIEITSLKADSKFGMDVLSKARRVEQDDGEVDMTFIGETALKFTGCHHVVQWNSEAEGADDVKIETKRLALFRLCPVDTCNSKAQKGCNHGYGDYIVDMDDFLASYLENKAEAEEEACESYVEEGNCDCENADYYEDCIETCYTNAKMDYCVEQDEQKVELNNYLECSQYEPSEDADEYYRNRRLEEGDDGEEEEDIEYYMGTYCSSSGGSVLLGMFTDDECTNFADNNGGRTTFYQMEGESLPYSEESIVDTACMSCQDTEVYYDNYGNEEQAVEAKETCMDVYSIAGKCETDFNEDGNAANTNACTYISGIHTVGANGIINSGNGGSNSVASAFIFVFSVSFVLLGSYVYYLKTKLDRAKINLSD